MTKFLAKLHFAMQLGHTPQLNIIFYVFALFVYVFSFSTIEMELQIVIVLKDRSESMNWAIKCALHETLASVYDFLISGL